MESWWSGLTLPLQIFYVIGVISGVLLVVEAIMTLVGFDHHNVGDASFEGVDQLGVLSVRSITGFFFGFGWSGVIALKSGMSLVGSTVVACVVGFFFLIGIYGLMRVMFSLRSSGTLDYNNAIGQVGTVYVTVPGRHGGGGQVEILIQGRLQVISCMTKNFNDLAPQSKVRVTGLVDRSTLEVEPL